MEHSRGWPYSRGGSILAFVSVALAAAACSTEGGPSEGELKEATDSTSSAQTSATMGASNNNNNNNNNVVPGSGTLSGVTIRWSVGEETSSLDASAPVVLTVSNHGDVARDVEVALQLWGLRVHRVLGLGTVHIEGHGSEQVTWTPSGSTIQPVEQLLRVLAQARYDDDGRSLAAPAPLLFGAFDATTSHVFLSPRDGDAAIAAARSATGAKRRVREVGSRRGRIDGHWVNESAKDAARNSTFALVSPTAQPSSGTPLMRTSPLDAETGDIGDTFTSDVALGGGAEAASCPTCPVEPGPCLGGTWVSAPVCVRWRPTGFRDIFVGTENIPYEAYNPFNARAAYANVTVTSGSSVVFSGRTDADGCTTPITFCSGSTPNFTAAVSSASLQKPMLFPTPASRELQITPGVTFTAPVLASVGTSPPYPWYLTANVFASTEQQEYVLRVASIASRILVISDSGLRFGQSSAAVFHTDNGCCSYPQFHYTDATGSHCGEACANSSGAWFGEGLSFPGGSGAPPTLTGVHTTEDAYTIAHEIGHTVAADSNVGPGSSYNPPLTGNCSCDHVTNGNRLHCLQSSHDHATAFTEGWAHFYATRVMNNKGSAGARFTYYKDVKKWVQTPSGWTAQTLHPPVPILASSPYLNPQNSITGWVRSFCSAANQSSEYDWLTFLWAINAKNLPGSFSMLDMFGVFGNLSGAGTNFTWTSLVDAAIADWGVTSARVNRFSVEGNNSGVSL